MHKHRLFVSGFTVSATDLCILRHSFSFPLLPAWILLCPNKCMNKLLIWWIYKGFWNLESCAFLYIFHNHLSASPLLALCWAGRLEDHCRVWGKDHTPGKGGAELRAGGRAGEQKGWETTRGSWRGMSRIHPTYFFWRNEGKKEGKEGKEGRKEKEERKY